MAAIVREARCLRRGFAESGSWAFGLTTRRVMTSARGVTVSEGREGFLGETI